jgi:hypothetical protein
MKLKQKTKRLEDMNRRSRWVLLMEKTVGKKSVTTVPLNIVSLRCHNISAKFCLNETRVGENEMRKIDLRETLLCSLRPRFLSQMSWPCWIVSANLSFLFYAGCIVTSGWRWRCGRWWMMTAWESCCKFASMELRITDPFPFGDDDACLLPLDGAEMLILSSMFTFNEVYFSGGVIINKISN